MFECVLMRTHPAELLQQTDDQLQVILRNQHL